MLTIAAIAMVTAGFTCVNQDYSIIRSVDIVGKAGDVFEDRTLAPYSARLTVDYVVVAAPDAPLDIELSTTTLTPDAPDDAGTASDGGGTATVDASDDAAATDATADDTGTTDGTPTAMKPPGFLRERIQLDRGARRVGRVDEALLGTGVGVQLSATCLRTPCLATLTYNVVIAQRECRVAEDCTAANICDKEYGRCLPRSCATDNDCSGGQSCDLDFGRCRDSSTLGCAVPPAEAPPSLPLAPFLLLAGLGLWAARRKELRRWLGAGAVALLVSAASPETASAQTSFDRPQAGIGLTTGVQWFTGEMSDVTSTGLALEYNQSLLYRNFGIEGAIGTVYFLTFQDPPPVGRGMQLYNLRLSPLFIYPWRNFRFRASLEYDRFGVISNALIAYTGTDLNFDALGGGLEARWNLSPVIAGVKLGYVQFLEFPSGLLTLGLEVSIQNGI